MTKPIPNHNFCGKCLRRLPGGTGKGRKYRCPECTAGRLAALAKQGKVLHA